MPVVGKPPKDFAVTGSPEDFQRWLDNFKTYLEVVEINAKLTSPQKHALLLNCIGEEADKVISALSYVKTTDPYENLIVALTDYFVPQSNLTYERYRFRKLIQESKIMPFINELHQVAKKCDFENKAVDSIYNQNIRDQFVLGVQSDELRRKLLSEKNLTLSTATQIAVAHEASVEEVQVIKDSQEKPKPILNVRSRSSSPQHRGHPPHRRNVRFNEPKKQDPVVCFYCKKPGHLKRNCFKLKNANNHMNKRRSLFNLNDVAGPSPIKDVYCTFFDVPLRGVVDTGATVSLISEAFLKRAQLQRGVVKASHEAKLPDGNLFTLKQGISGPFSIGSVQTEAFFFVTKNLPCDCLVGMNLLKLFKSIQVNEEGPDLILGLLPEPLSEFSDIFDRSLRDACYSEDPHPIIELSNDAVPIQCKVRHQNPRDRNVCKEQVKKLLEEGVIEKSRSPWRHSPVVVPKRTGGFRMAVDYRPVNSMTKMDAYPIPSIQDLLQRLEGCKFFSSLDFSQFYYQLPLHPDDREKTAFYVDGELYQFRRCTFGLKNAVSFCTRIMHEMLKGIPGVSIYVDDILIHAKTVNEHDEILRTVLTKIRENNLSLNMSKCSFYQKEVSYLGHRISDGKISPDPERTKVISQFPTPKTVKELQRFLGMCNFFRNYLAGYASLSKELYAMCSPSVTQDLTWTSASLKAFNALKDGIAKSVLTFPSKDDSLHLYVDASNNCVGACLATDKGQPITFASKKLTEVESRWSTIDKEAYAVIFAIQKLRSFLLDKHFTVFSDHQPLKYLFQSSKVSAKVHRWRALVAEFNFDVKYIRGEENAVADSLSRVLNIADVDSEGEMSIDKQTFVAAQKRDPESKALYRAVSNNYSRKPADVSHDMWSFKRNCFISDSLLKIKDRIFVPKNMRTKILTATHYGHQGMESMLNKLLADYFWPKMKHDVNDFVRNCRICSLVKPQFINAELKPYLLDAPMQLVVTDFIGPLPSDKGYRYILVIMDAFSRFPETYPVRDLSSATLISKFRDFFSRYGFPDAILSDNGTQYRSKEFQTYLEPFNIKHAFTNTYRPSSNGLCERFNGTLQKKIKCLLLEYDLQPNSWTRVLPTAAMAVRNDVNRTTGYTPSQLFLAFRVKDLSLAPACRRSLPIKALGANAARRAASVRHRACSRKRGQNRWFPKGSEVVIKPTQKPPKLTVGTKAIVTNQVDQYTVAVELDGKEHHCSTARVSPVPAGVSSPCPKPPPATSSARTRRLPGYLKDYKVPDFVLKRANVD